ncbi:hypothetical protein ACS8E9_09560 [Pseudomonas neustonica]|uniref:hypothetical protein n=1 Tax=Pseudomonas neustonica TaxID=2487346 RepID=UPI003F4707DA
MTNTELSGGDAVLRVKALEQQIAALEAEKVGRQQALPSGWVPLLIEYESGYPEEVAFGPQIMMDRLKKWLDKHFSRVAENRMRPSHSGLADALRQYRHNDGSEGFVFGYDKGAIDRYVAGLLAAAPAPAERVDESSFEQYRLAAEFAEQRGVVEKSTNRAIVVDAFATGYGFGITAKPAPAAPDVAASDVAGLVEVSSKILAKLRHPTHSVNILDTEALERALGPFQRKEG